MRIDIQDALRAPGSVFGFEASGRPESMALSESYLPEGESVKVQGDYCLVEPGRVMVRANFTAEMESLCSRCAKSVVFGIREHAEQLFVQGDVITDQTIYAFSGHVLDLSAWARDIVLSALPMRVYCAEGCKGLCSVCGADLNAGPCEHMKDME